MRTLRRNAGRSFAVTLLLAAAGSAWACGLENPYSVASQRGMMNLAFPQSAWVRTAIWQAQMAGELPRDELAGRDDLTPQAIGTLRLMRASVLLRSLAKRLGAARDDGGHPSVALVLMGPMMWSRFEPMFGSVQARVHVNGPEKGDVVMVTDTPAIEAIVEGGLSFEQAIERGLVRLYGPQAQIDQLSTWLATT